MSDVVVTHPASPSRASLAPGVAAFAAEGTKTTKYGQLAASRGSILLPFALETYGTFGPQATELLKILRNSGSGSVFASLPSVSGRTFGAQALAVTLQRGNAVVSKAGSLAARVAARERMVV